MKTKFRIKKKFSFIYMFNMGRIKLKCTEMGFSFLYNVNPWLSNTGSYRKRLYA